jgi:hypothetical protein
LINKANAANMADSSIKPNKTNEDSIALLGGKFNCCFVMTSLSKLVAFAAIPRLIASLSPLQNVLQSLQKQMNILDFVFDVSNSICLVGKCSNQLDELVPENG